MNLKKILNITKEVVPYVAALLSVWVITTFIVTGTKVDGYSMYPTFSDGDFLLTDRLTYRIGEVDRFDVVIFDLNKNNNESPYYLIKRVIGLPGETVRIDTAGNIYVNNEIVEESYGAETILDPGMAINTITLGEDEYFVMGDNRNNSLDSRFEQVGSVKRNQIIGEPFLQIYPFQKFGGLK